MFKLRRTVLLIALSAMLSGCWLFYYELDYELVGLSTSTDPISGDVTRIYYWRYEDGRETTTTDVIHKGEDNEQRRGERPEPGARFSEP